MQGLFRLRQCLAGVLLAFALVACSGQELYRDIDEREANEMISVLTRAGIDYTGIDTRESSLEDIFVSLLGEGAA